MHLIDKLSYNNGLSDVHPVEKFVFSMGALAFVLVTSNSYLMFLLFILMSLLIIVFAKTGFLNYLKLLCIPALFIFLSAVTLVMEIDPAAEGALSINPRGLVYGGTLCLKAFSSVSCMYFFILTTPVADVEFILKKMSFPLLFREIFMMVYRFIFIIVDKAEMIAVSQLSRGGYSSLGNRVKSAGMLASSVFVKSYFFSRASYSAMLSRGYDGEFNVIDSEYRYSALNIFLIVSFFLCFIFLVIRFG